MLYKYGMGELIDAERTVRMSFDRARSGFEGALGQCANSSPSSI